MLYDPEEQIIVKPLKSGQIFQMLSAELLENWLMAYSRKNSGSAPISRNDKYGIKNAPEIYKKEDLAYNDCMMQNRCTKSISHILIVFRILYGFHLILHLVNLDGEVTNYQ